MLRTASLFALLFSSAQLFAQEPTMLVYGTVRDFATRDSIPFPVVRVHDILSADPPASVVSSAQGRYDLDLGQEGLYRVHFGAPGKVSRSVQIDTRGPSQMEWKDSFGMNIDIVLMDSLPGLDYSILSEPFGKAAWDRKSSSFTWNIAYTRARKSEMKALVARYNAALNKTKQP